MTKEKRVVESLYEKMGPVYNYVYGKLLFNEGRETSIELLEIEKDHKILEVGVGTGLTFPLYPHDCEVTGVDLSESMLKEARKLIQKKHIKNAKVKMMDATNLEFPDNHFDGVLGNLFISATSQPERCLEEMKRVCKPHGHIVLMNHFKSENLLFSSVESMLSPLANWIGFKSNLEMTSLLHSVGLKAKKVEKVNFLNLWTAVSMENKK